MSQTNQEKIEAIKTLRYQKAQNHLEQYAPIWLVDDKVIVGEDAVQFNVVFQHPTYGWVNRRYRYDAFSDVLFQKGQRTVDEDDALEIQEQEPYIAASMMNSIDSYGG